MTTAEARKAGYEVVRGAYVGTTDNRLDRWYIEPVDATAVDRTYGYRTRREALEAVERIAKYGPMAH